MESQVIKSKLLCKLIFSNLVYCEATGTGTWDLGSGTWEQNREQKIETTPSPSADSKISVSECSLLPIQQRLARWTARTRKWVSPTQSRRRFSRTYNFQEWESDPFRNRERKQNQNYGTTVSNFIRYKVVDIRYRVQIFHFYFHLATLTCSTKSYGFLINFSLIMLDSPWLLFSLSTW